MRGKNKSRAGEEGGGEGKVKWQEVFQTHGDQEASKGVSWVPRKQQRQGACESDATNPGTKLPAAPAPCLPQHRGRGWLCSAPAELLPQWERPPRCTRPTKERVVTSNATTSRKCSELPHFPFGLITQTGAAKLQLLYSHTGRVLPPLPQPGRPASVVCQHWPPPRESFVISLVLYSLIKREWPRDRTWSPQIPPLNWKFWGFGVFFASHPLSSLSKKFVSDNFLYIRICIHATISWNSSHKS